MPGRRSFLRRAFGAVFGLAAMPAAAKAGGVGGYATGGLGMVGEGPVAFMGVDLGHCFSAMLGPSRPKGIHWGKDSWWTDTSVSPPVTRYWTGFDWVTDAEIAAATGAPSQDDPCDPWQEAA